MSLFKSSSVLLSITIGTVGLIGSNFLFNKQKLTNIDTNDNNRWNGKLGSLFFKVKDNIELAGKIDTEGQGVALANNPNKTDFQEKDKALKALKGWCSKEDKGQETKHEDELCKYGKPVGWLFGNA